MLKEFLKKFNRSVHAFYCKAGLDGGAESNYDRARHKRKTEGNTGWIQVFY